MGRMSLGTQVVVFALLGVLLYGVYWWFFHSPMQQQIQDKTATKRNLQAEVDNAKTTAARLPEFRREVERKEATLQALSRILPSQKEVDDLLRKVQQLAAAIATDYGNDAGRIWSEARDGADLQRRLLALPGIGEMKAKSLLAILGKRLGVALPGMADVMPKHPTLGDVDSAEALARYQAGKRAMKAEMRAAKD